MTVRIKDPISALTHFVGAVLSLVALAVLIQKGYYLKDNIYIVGSVIFGISMFLLYTASTVYHTVSKSEKVSKVLKKIDHTMIFVLIAGTYTPICLIPLGAANMEMIGLVILITVWSVAALGIILKIVWLNAPRWLYTLQYILMGWIALFAIVPLLHSLTSTGFILLLSGGIIYTIGGVIYATKWPKMNFKWVGFHEVFHLFVLGGSACHYFMVLGLA